MKLSTKLKLSFCLVTVLPILLLGVAVVGFGTMQIHSLEKNYGVEDAGHYFLSNPIHLYEKYIQNIKTEVENVIKEDLSKLSDVEYLNQLNKKLMEKHSYLIVQRAGELIYVGKSENLSKLESRLKQFFEEDGDASSVYVSEGMQFLIKEMSFAYEDKTEGRVFLVTEMTDILPQMKSFIYELLVTLVLVTLLTGVVLTFWIYKSVMFPMRRLHEATCKIAQGDLNFTLEEEAKSEDEFGYLFQDFEQMRIRLKQNAEDKLQDDAQSKELISNISHDLKTPITAIKGYVEGIMDGVADTPEKMERYIHTIYNKANDMDKLIGELTMYSKIDTNRIPYNFNKVRIDSYFEDCIQEIGMELEAKGIELHYFNYLSPDIIVIADVEQMSRVINNIISNSEKYIGTKKGVLNIRLNEEGDFVHIEIEDNGRGIGVKELPLIFDRFYRTDASRNSSQGGSGIGLSIAKKIVDAHGGKIWATSKEGMGTTMHIILRKYFENYGKNAENENVEQSSGENEQSSQREDDKKG